MGAIDLSNHTRTMRVRVWHRLDMVHKAAIDVVQRILERGDEGLVARIKKSEVIGTMVKRAAQHLLRVLQDIPQALPYRFRAILEDAGIVREKTTVCGESGVFD